MCVCAAARTLRTHTHMHAKFALRRLSNTGIGKAFATLTFNDVSNSLSALGLVSPSSERENEREERTKGEY